MTTLGRCPSLPDERHVLNPGDGMTGQKIPEFNILALGPPGSGKTIYLAMLHFVISTGKLPEGVSFTIDDNTNRSWLHQVYNDMRDKNRLELSEGTQVGDIREIGLRCKVEWPSRRGSLGRQIRGESHTALVVNYTDYAGERFTRASDFKIEGMEDAFQQKLQQAHVLLGIIDGEKLRRYLEDPAAHPLFFLDNVWPIVETIRSRPVPGHFVITKWDLLDGYTIEEIQTLLLESTSETGYESLLQARSAERCAAGQAGRIRLIPVSSVGGFVQLGPKGMRKVGQAPLPKNVEIPLIASLVDICDMARDAHREQQRLEREAPRRTTAKSGGENSDSSDAEITVGPTGLKINLTAVAAFSVHAGAVVGRELGRPALGLGRFARREYRRVRSHGLTGVRSEEGALFYVGRGFQGRLADYEDRQQPQTARALSSPASPEGLD